MTATLVANPLESFKIKSETQVKEEPSKPEEQFSGVSPEEKLENNSLDTNFKEEIKDRFVKHLYFDRRKPFISVLI